MKKKISKKDDLSLYKVLIIFLLAFLFKAEAISQQLAISGHSMAALLQSNMIWSGNDDGKPGYTVFRKTFDETDIATATINIFADSRYILWINGVEVLRGPCRFDPVSPSYDSADVTSFLNKGKNAIVVMVMSHGSNGKTMNHHPGVTVGLKIKSQGQKVKNIGTDSSWKWNNHTRFLPAVQLWADMSDRIDARLDDGDWTRADYDDKYWSTAVSISGKMWGALTLRSIPYLTKNEMDWVPLSKKNLPVGLKSGESWIIKANEMIQGYPIIRFEAEEGVQIQFDFGYIGDSVNIKETYGSTCFYTARGGEQTYIPTDSYGFRYLKITVLSGSIYAAHNVLLKQINLIDRRYPYIEAGNFTCDDLFLNDLFNRSVLTTKLNCEDGYTDCALREKVEWMGDAALIQYPLTRSIFAVSDSDGILRSDHKLMVSMLRHIAQSQNDSGMFKAHHPSDRFDIHAYIEDYSCLWVQALRQVYEFTGDKNLVSELWNPLKKQMKWFEDRRSANGLVYGREFTFFDNPLAYCSCNGATLNAYLYKAFVDASFLASVIGDKQSETEYKKDADELAQSFNKNLWIPSKQTYSSGISDGKQLTPTAHAAMMALNRGIVPKNRISQVQDYLFAHYQDREGNRAGGGKIPETFYNLNHAVPGIDSPYCTFWLLEELFKMDQSTAALDFIRKKWNYILKDTQTGTLAEAFGGGDLCHNNGAIPAYFLSTKVLGVSEKIPLNSKKIEIKPMLGDLKQAEGTVVTAHGIVYVRWEKKNNGLEFSIKIPEGITAQVILPYNEANNELLIDNKKTAFKIEKNNLIFNITTNETNGSYR